MTLLDWIIPARALRWGVLTTEPVAWHLESLRYTHAATQAEIARLFAPAWKRLGYTLAATLDAVAEDYQRVKEWADDLTVTPEGVYEPSGALVLPTKDDIDLAEFRRRYLTEQEPM